MTSAVILELKSAMLTVLDKLSGCTASFTEGHETVKYIMGTLLNLIKILLYSHKHIPLSREHLDLSMCIASLPWIGKVDSEYANIVPCGNGWNLAKLKQLADVIVKDMDSGVCLEVFTMFPSEFLTKWKVYVFKETLVRMKMNPVFHLEYIVLKHSVFHLTTNHILLLQSSSDYQNIHTTVIKFLPVLLATLEGGEQNEILDAVLKHSNSEFLQLSLCKYFGQLDCALFRCLKTSLDVTKFPPTFEGSRCSLCDSGDKSKNVLGTFKLTLVV